MPSKLDAVMVSGRWAERRGGRTVRLDAGCRCPVVRDRLEGLEDLRSRGSAGSGQTRRPPPSPSPLLRPIRRRGDRTTKSAATLTSALRAHRDHRAAGPRGVPSHAPLDFVPAALQPLIPP